MADWNDGDVIRATAKMSVNGVYDIQNVFHWTYGGAPVAASTAITALAQAIDDMYDSIEPEISQNVQFTEIDIQNVTQGEVYAAVDWPVQNTGGNSGGTLMPLSNALLVVGRTNRSKTMGKKYIGGLTESANSSGQWTGAILGMVTSFIADYLASITISSGKVLTPVVAHYLAGGIVDYVTNLVTGFYTTNPVQQRRRRAGTGS